MKTKRPTVGNRAPKAIERAGGIELRFDGRGEFDELVVKKGAAVHIERMDDGFWWLMVAAGDHCVTLNLCASSPRALVHPLAEWECECSASHAPRITRSGRRGKAIAASHPS